MIMLIIQYQKNVCSAIVNKYTHLGAAMADDELHVLLCGLSGLESKLLKQCGVNLYDI